MRSTKLMLVAVATALLMLNVSGAQSAEPVKIRIAWVVPVANWSTMLTAKKDLAKHWGKSYVVEPVHFAGTPLMINALASGDLEIADLAYSSFALAVENAGMHDLRVIADEFQDGVPGYFSDEYLVRKDSSIKTVKDLKGKVLATNAAGSAVDIAMRAMLRKNHLNDKTDVNIVEAHFPNMKAMLLEKKADLIPGILPFAMNPELRAKSRVLFYQQQAMGRTQMIIYAAREKFLKEHRKAMLDFMEDFLRIVHFYLNPANHQAAVEIASKLTKAPAAAFQGWLFTKKDYYRSPNLLPDLNALQDNINTQYKLGFIKSEIDVKKYADLSLVKEAAKRLK